MMDEGNLLRLADPQLTRHIFAKFQDSHPGDAEACYLELLKFLYLTSKYSRLRGTFIPVTQEVDDFWHEAILQTRYYQKLCKSLPGGEFIHHESMAFDAYTERKSKEILVEEILSWVSCYVANFGDFRADRIKHWFFVSKVMDVLNLSLDDLNSYAKRGHGFSLNNRANEQSARPNPVTRPTTLAIGREWAARVSNKGRQVTKIISTPTVDSVLAMASACRSSLEHVLFGAFCVLLERYTQEAEVAIATTMPGLASKHTARSSHTEGVGVVRVAVDTSKSFCDFITIAVDPLVADPHGDAYLAFHTQDCRTWSTEALREAAAYDGLIRHDLTLGVRRYEDTLGLTFEYSTELYSDDLIEDLAANYVKLIELASRDVNVPIADLDAVFSQKEPTNSVWTELCKDGPRRTIIDEYRAAAAEQQLDRLIEFGDEHLSSASFWRLVFLKARNLRQAYKQVFHRDIAPGESIGLESTRSIETPSDMLAILFAGASYVPFDPRDPDERRQFILADAGVNLIVTQGFVVCEALTFKYPLSHDLGHDIDLLTLPTPDPSQLAYVIYTSGSTGKPKGVKVSHDALWHYVKWFGSFDITQTSQRFDLSINLTFDASITTSLVALAYGKFLSICSEEIKSSPRAFLSYLSKKKIDLCKCTPSYFKLLVKEAQNYGTDLSQPMTWLLSGEDMNAKDTAAWLVMHPNHVFHNSYGPTEATVTCSKFRIDRHNIHAFPTSIPIEQQSRSARFHILCPSMRSVPHGVRGELFIEGPILANGYQNNEGKTEQAFVKSRSGCTLYRTGDQVMSFPDGRIHYYGRLDDQVKINGVRIELDEVRHAICSFPDTVDAKVLAHTVDGSTRLAAFVVPGATDVDETLFRDGLQAFLSNKLMAAAMPSKFILLDKLPFNQAGKIDTQALNALLMSSAPAGRKKLVETPLEMSLLNIWRKSFPHRRIGADSNFFNLGGHSLLVMEVMDQINRHYNSSLPPHFLFQHPTIRQLARAIREAQKDTHLHHFQYYDDGPMLALVHPATGLALPYASIQNYTSNLSVCAFSNDRFGDRETPYLTLEEMAQSYLTALKPYVAHRPIVLGGFCTGGAVAYEMAKQLELAGRKPAGLILIDSFKLESIGCEESRAAYRKSLFERIGIDEYSVLGKQISFELEQNRRLVANYQPKSFAGPTMLLQCRHVDEDDVNYDDIRRLMASLNGWAGYADPRSMHRVEVDASHKSILHEDSAIEEVGSAIAGFIQSLTGGVDSVYSS